MEKKFLTYILYITLVELREQAYEKKDNKTFWLCDMLHNVPGALLSKNETKEAYKKIFDTVNHLGIHEWLNLRKTEFYNSFPEYEGQI